MHFRRKKIVFLSRVPWLEKVFETHVTMTVIVLQRYCLHVPKFVCVACLIIGHLQIYCTVGPNSSGCNAQIQYNTELSLCVHLNPRLPESRRLCEHQNTMEKQRAFPYGLHHLTIN